MNKKLFALAAAILFVSVSLIITQEARATTLDFSTGTLGWGQIGIAYYTTTQPKGSGTGNIQTFEEIYTNNQAPYSQAYNTIESVFDNGSADNFNRALLLSEVPIVYLDGISGAPTGNFYEFLFDGNEPGGEVTRLISIDEIQLIRSSAVNPSTESFTGGGIIDIPGSLAYRLDSGGDSWIIIDAIGSGEADLFMYIPTSAFTGSGDYVYLYTQLGAQAGAGATDGFDEWAVKKDVIPPPVIPEPASLSLFGLGLLGLLGLKKRS